MRKVTKAILKLREKRRLKRELKHKDKFWRNSVLERDNHLCQICAFMNIEKTQRLNVHHILPKKHYPWLRHDIMNGITLCSQHHAWAKLSPHTDSFGFYHYMLENKFEQLDYLLSYVLPKEKIIIVHKNNH